MNCPVCGDKTSVVSTRKDCEGVYRSRVCMNLECKHNFFTTELESDRDDFDRLNREANIKRYRRRHNKNYNKNYNKIG